MLLYCGVQTLDLGQSKITARRHDIRDVIFGCVSNAARSLVLHKERTTIDFEMRTQLVYSRFKYFRGIQRPAHRLGNSVGQCHALGLLLQFTLSALSLDGQRGLAAHRGQEFQILFGIGVLVFVVLHHKYAQGARWRPQRYTQPGSGRCPAILDFASLNHLICKFSGQQQRFTRLQHVAGETFLANRARRRYRVVLVEPKLKMNQVSCRIMQRYETVLRVKEFTD